MSCIDLTFPSDGSRIGELIRAYDWGNSPLGSSLAWPGPLKTLISVMLAANQPMFVAWGPEQVLIYNDAYAGILGARHPAALGKPFFTVWPEVADSVGPIMARCFASRPAWTT